MASPDVIKKAAAKIRQLAEERKQQEQENRDDYEAARLAMELSQTDAVIQAIKESKMPTEEISRVFTEAVQKIIIKSPDITVPKAEVEVKMPDIKIPEIKLPPINVPKPEVTVNVPEMKFPKMEAPVVNFELPDRINVGLEDFTLKNPLPVMPVDAAGKLLVPNAGGGGGKAGRISYSWKHITAAETFLVKSGGGILHRLIINTATNSTISLYDGLDATGNVIAVVFEQGSVDPVSLEYDVAFSKGLTIATAETADLTVVYE